MAACCAAVGLGFSTGSSPIFDGLPDEDDDDELLLPLLFSLLVRLQAATTRKSRTRTGRFFIDTPSTKFEIGKQAPFTITSDKCQMKLSRERQPVRQQGPAGRHCRLGF